MGLDRTTLTTRVRRFVNDVSTTASKQRFSDTLIQDALNDAITEFANDSLLKKDQDDWATTAGDNDYTFPTDAFKVYRIDLAGKLLYATSMTELDQWKRDWRNDDIGEPLSWYPTTGRNFKVYPNANVAADGLLYFFDIPAALASATEEPDFAGEYHIAVANGAAANLLTWDREFDLAAAFQGKFEVFKKKAETRLRRMEDRAKNYEMTIDRGQWGDGTTVDPLKRIFWGS